jgi:drug/metabolite transporter (DMT)-like permease
MLSISLALVAALLFALGTVLQQRVAMTASDAETHSAWVLLRLARHPVWLGGIVLTWVGFGFHAAALSHGELVFVQPVLAMTVVFALPMGARLSAQRIERRDYGAALLAAGGLAAFLLISNPDAGIEDPGAGAWVFWGGAMLVVGAALTAAGLHRRPALKATLVGTAAGVLFGLHGAITKEMTEQLHSGPLLGDWAVWGVLILGAISMSVSQIALQAGDLSPAVATESIFSPLIAVVLGVGLFEEAIHSSAAGTAASLLALAAMLAGVAILSRREGRRLGERGERTGSTI